MTSQLESSKIDALVGIGVSKGEQVSKIDGLVAFGISKGLEVSKIDAFISLAPVTPSGTYRVVTGSWIGGGT